MLASTPLSAIPWAAVDLELTGLDPERDRICEVAVVRVQGGRVVDRWASLVRPDAPVTPGARQIHGITDEELRGAPAFRDVMEELVGRLEGAVVVGHHVAFDLDFLNRALAAEGEAPLAGESLDTLRLARRLFAFRNHKLGAICRALDVPLCGAHRAMGDAEASVRCLLAMLELVGLGPDATLADLRQHLDDLGADGPAFSAHLERVREALAARQTVWLEYLSPVEDGGYTVTRREVAVWKVRKPRVQGWCYLREEERVFRVERIRAVEPGERSYEIPRFRSRV